MFSDNGCETGYRRSGADRAGFMRAGQCREAHCSNYRVAGDAEGFEYLMDRTSRNALIVLCLFVAEVSAQTLGPHSGFPNVPPQAVAASPPVGNGTTQSFSFSFAQGGLENIFNGGLISPRNFTVLDVLINSALDGRNSCYLAFVPTYNGNSSTGGSLFLVDNAGDAGGPYSGVTLPGTGIISNSQCSIDASGSSWANNALTLAITFLTLGFAGNKVIYMAAQDTQEDSGWQPMGTWTVAGGSASEPLINGITPARSMGYSQSYTFTFTDPNGWPDISVANILVNNAINGIGACYMAVVLGSAGSGTVFLVDDAGDSGGLFTAVTLPGSGKASNGQCTIWGQGSSISASGNTLTVTLSLTFQPAFEGPRVIYAAVRGGAGNSGWQPVGTVFVTLVANSTPPYLFSISQLTPPSVREGSSAFTLTVTGNSFQTGAVCPAVCGSACPSPSVVSFDHVDIPTTVISTTQLQGLVPASLLAMPRTVDVVARNPIVYQCLGTVSASSAAAGFTVTQ